MTSAPRASYRLQLHADFDFDDAAAIADYLADLGVSHVYCSPLLQAVPGSSHGYDIVDYGSISRELGGWEGYRRFCDALRQAGLALVLDIVPNHMAIAPQNAWWWDVLENGPSSQYASYFDVDWAQPDQKLSNLVLVPVLADRYGRCLESGEILLARDGAEFTIRYRDHILPLAPRSLGPILFQAAEDCGSDELAFVADAHANLPLPTWTDGASARRRHRDMGVLKSYLARLLAGEPEIARAVDHVVERINGDADRMDAVLENQNYRLAFWRVASQELPYRRFFDINSLVCLRTEEDEVFADTHRLMLSLLKNGLVEGLRIDHVDGLRDPQRYLERLRTEGPDTWIVVEKILGAGERIPETWPVAGTTGYDFLNIANGLFVDSEGEQKLTDFYQEFTGRTLPYCVVARESKKQILKRDLATDVSRLTAQLAEICETRRHRRDYTREELRQALVELIAAFPVYRTYVRAEAGSLHPDDHRIIRRTAEAVKANGSDVDSELLDFIVDLLALRETGELEADLAMRFQQLTAPVMAKGVEDTAYYRYNRLTSLNEVGGDPGRPGVSVTEFHSYCAEMYERWPHSMLATSTHDTKRSEDVRLRINLLSEIPEKWAEAVRRWSRMNDDHRSQGFPDRNIEYLFYQTLVGTWPIDVTRLQEYMLKAAREAKESTSWQSEDTAYEEALDAFVAGALANGRFISDLEAFVAPLREPAQISSLALALIKLTAPGVPDIYQGCELWTSSLVDPDNRRPVDFELRRRLLREAEDSSPETAWKLRECGLPKLWLIARTLRLGKERADALVCGDYRSLTASGECEQRVVAYARGGEVAVVAPRLVLGLPSDWGDTQVMLPSGTWRNHLTGDCMQGGAVRVAEILARFPTALFVREEGAS